MTDTLKTFLLIDDKHPDYFVGRITRTDAQITPALRALKVGDTISTSNRRAIMREN